MGHTVPPSVALTFSLPIFYRFLTDTYLFTDNIGKISVFNIGNRSVISTYKIGISSVLRISSVTVISVLLWQPEKQRKIPKKGNTTLGRRLNFYFDKIA